nr:hypothetical protein [uncultured Oscillibacter sp.]
MSGGTRTLFGRPAGGREMYAYELSDQRGSRVRLPSCGGAARSRPVPSWTSPASPLSGPSSRGAV